jgi:glycosyltransferase involved in cell wall biosynthesis
MAMNENAAVVVVAPVPWFDRHGISDAARVSPRERRDGRLVVVHPRWFNIPGGGLINSVLLAFCVLLTALRIRRHFVFGIIDAHFGYVDGVAAAIVSAILRRPFVVTLRGSEVVHARYPLRRQAMAWALGRASRVIAVSAGLRDFAVGLGLPPEKIAVVPNGVDTELFHQGGRRSEGCARFHVPPDSRIVISVGTLNQLKGHHRVIQALAGLVARGFDAYLLIAGAEQASEPDYVSGMRRLASELNVEQRVRLLGSLPPQLVAEAMACSDVLCLASDREGCPNVIREALACGAPVVATRVGAVPELIPTDAYGLIVPKEDPPALEQALAAALSREWDRQAIASWGRSRSWEQAGMEALKEIELAAG